MKYILLLSFLFLSFGSYAQRASQNTTKTSTSSKIEVPLDELRKIQKNLQNYNVLSLNFEQNIFKKLRKKHSKNSGTVYFKKPASFRWKFTRIDPEEWIYDGVNLFRYFPNKSYADRYKAHASKAKNLREIVSIVLDFDSLLRRYTVVSSWKEQNKVFLTLNPIEVGEIIEVQLVLDLKNNFISEVKLKYEGGNESAFVFSNPQHNEIKDEFSLPPHVKINDPI